MIHQRSRRSVSRAERQRHRLCVIVRLWMTVRKQSMTRPPKSAEDKVEEKNDRELDDPFLAMDGQLRQRRLDHYARRHTLRSMRRE